MSLSTESMKPGAEACCLGDKWCVERWFMGPSRATLSAAACKLPIRSFFIFRVSFY